MTTSTVFLKEITPEDINTVRRETANALRHHYTKYSQINFGYPRKVVEKSEMQKKSLFDCTTPCCIAGFANLVGHVQNLIDGRRIDHSSQVNNVAGVLLGTSEHTGYCDTEVETERSDKLDIFEGDFDCLTDEERSKRNNLIDVLKSDDPVLVSFQKELQRKNAFRVAQLLDRLADGMPYAEAVEKRCDPVDETIHR